LNEILVKRRKAIFSHVARLTDGVSQSGTPLPSRLITGSLPEWRLGTPTRSIS